MVGLRIRPIIFLFCSVILSAASGSATPSPSAFRDALISAWRVHMASIGKPDSKDPGIQVREIQGCFPVASENKADADFVCLVDMNRPDGTFSVTPVPIRMQGEKLKVVNPQNGSIAPGCPEVSVVEPLLRRTLRDERLKVLGLPEEGVFSDQRGKFREKSGPLRLMCTYEVLSGFGGNSTVVSYFSRPESQYLIESEVERWSD